MREKTPSKTNYSQRDFMSLRWHYDAENNLCWQTKPLNKLFQFSNYQKPTYVYDLSYLKRRGEFFLKSAPLKSKSFYALKANSNSEILKTLKTLGFGLDVVSQGEIERGLAVGFSASDIIFSGVGKTAAEISFAIKNKIHQFNVESLGELERIGNLSKKLQIPTNVAFRMNPEVAVETHPYIATGLRENKFGLNSEHLPEAIQILKSFPSLKFVGLSQHIGSQLFDLDATSEAIDKLLLMKLQAEKLGFSVQRLDIGGGIGIYYDQDCEEKELQFIQDYMNLVKNKLSQFSGEIQFEPGRCLVGHAGFIISQVQYIKTNQHKSFVILDTGMHHLIRPSLYQAFHSILPVKKKTGTLTADIVGPICESSDVLAADRSISQVLSDDFVIIADCGAYGFSMASLYNSHKLPNEVCIFDHTDGTQV